MAREGERSSASRGLVCVFAKVPRTGRVKTRLARVIGHELAAQLAEAFLVDTLGALRAFGGIDVELALDASDAPEVARLRLLKALAEPGNCDQGLGDLGARMERVLERALPNRPWVLVLGSDCPGLPRAHLARAIQLLEDPTGPDTVFGPARDGGYYCFGVRRFQHGLLSGVRWSSSSALADSERSVALAGLSSARSSDWFDVDEASDLAELRRLLAARRIHAPTTAGVLSTFEPREPQQYG